MESNKSPALIFEVKNDGGNRLASWKIFKARENVRLKLQMEGLKNTLEEQMRTATVLNLIELPPDNMDEEEVFNDRLDYREGELAGNYGRASKEAIEIFYGDSKPIFKYAESVQGKSERQVFQEVSEVLVVPDTQVILLDEASSTMEISNDSLFELTNDTHIIFPDSDSLPDLTTMETQVELAEIDLTELDFVTDL